MRQIEDEYVIQPVSLSHTFELTNINQNISFNAFQISLNSSILYTENIDIELLTCVSNLMFDYRLNFPFIEVILIQTDVITDPLQTQLRVIINNSTFSITTINLLPQHNIHIPTFSDDTYYIHVSHNHQVWSLVFMESLDFTPFEEVLYQVGSGNEDFSILNRF
ncbi:hypothetical protein LOD99_10734 [Oopsacas minuta]|uniref:Uncharacterized protein n=1 Tax=Oopsacas minuta TaxID=111878 RepID=A0AAV7KFL5_9METZ|nr:hypothetical protein LOD99_10734 [Oopsacas minuta]